MEEQHLRQEHIRAAETALELICTELDNLFDLVSFYLDRYPQVTVADVVRTTELQISIRQLGAIPHSISREVSGWKKGIEPVWSPLGLEVHVLNEIWAHTEAIVLFLIVNEIDLEPFNRLRLFSALQTIKIVSRHLSQPVKP